MDTSYISLIIFILTTILYFSFFKPSLNIQQLTDINNNYYISNLKSLILYFIFVLISQFILNINNLINKCGGNAIQHFKNALLFTFFPWLLIFGVIIYILILFPGFKSAFSDVIGYFVVYKDADNILTDLLVNTDVNKAIDKTTSIEEKENMIEAVETLTKIYGNNSILINKMNISNFLSIWDNLKPLMKLGAYEDIELKQNLLDVVILKENIGEAFWYVYTAILVISIIYYNFKKVCVQDITEIKEIKDERKEYEKQQELEKLQEEYSEDI
jgi:hypothetical protein